MLSDSAKSQISMKNLPGMTLKEDLDRDDNASLHTQDGNASTAHVVECNLHATVGGTVSSSRIESRC
jgi:hypothetical protein